MATTQRIRIEDPDEYLGQALSRVIEAAGYEVELRQDAAADGGRPAREHDAALLCDGVGDAADRVARLRANGCGVVLGVDSGPVTGHYRRALQLGCAGVVAPTSTAEEVEAAIASAVERGREARRAHEEQERREFRLAKLRRRCVEQATRFQENQDTFYLDLSRLMTIITNIMDGIVFVDRAGNVTLLNPGAEDLLGTKSFVALGKPLASIAGRHELVAALCRDHERLQTEKEVTQTVEVHHSEQDLLYIQCITSRVHDYRGQPAGALSVLKDVTAEFKTDQLKNQYLSIVAHELRTPLTGIKTFSTMMVKGALGALNEGQQRVCESIREQSLRLEHQIDKLINLGSLESADYGQDREICTVAEFVNGLLLPFEQSTRDRRIRLLFRAEAEEVQLFVDRADLRRACQALVENAIKFTPDGGSVGVFITRDDDGAPRFRVVDDGIGVDPRYHRRIFEKFFQVEDPLTRHHGGAGLGLFVAKGIVEAHGSRIEVSSQLGQGADFSFVMPVYRPTAAAVPQSNVLV